MGKIGFSGPPLLGNVHEDGGEEAQDGGFDWKKACDLGASFDLGVEGFAHDGSAQGAADIFGKDKNGEAFGNGASHPASDIGNGLGVIFDDLVETNFRLRAVAGAEDVSDVGGDLLAHGDFWNVGLGVLLEMELEAPRRGVESVLSEPSCPCPPAPTANLQRP